jgi:hypothetical protein
MLLYENTEGKVIKLNVKDSDGMMINMGAALTRIVHIKKPNGITVDLEPSVVNGSVEFTLNDVIDVPGVYKTQLEFSLSTGFKGRTETVEFEVKRNFT